MIPLYQIHLAQVHAVARLVLCFILKKCIHMNRFSTPGCRQCYAGCLSVTLIRTFLYIEHSRFFLENGGTENIGRLRQRFIAVVVPLEIQDFACCCSNTQILKTSNFPFGNDYFAHYQYGLPVFFRYHFTKQIACC